MIIIEIHRQLIFFNFGILATPEQERSEMKKRKLVQEITEKVYTLDKGPNFTTSIQKVSYTVAIRPVVSYSYDRLVGVTVVAWGCVGFS